MNSNLLWNITCAFRYTLVRTHFVFIIKLIHGYAIFCIYSHAYRANFHQLKSHCQIFYFFHGKLAFSSYLELRFTHPLRLKCTTTSGSGALWQSWVIKYFKLWTSHKAVHLKTYPQVQFKSEIVAGFDVTPELPVFQLMKSDKLRFLVKLKTVYFLPLHNYELLCALTNRKPNHSSKGVFPLFSPFVCFRYNWSWLTRQLTGGYEHRFHSGIS